MRAVVTVVGKDKTGIIARVRGLFYEKNINILDISQTIVQGYFNMMMIVDMNSAAKGFGAVQEDLDKFTEGLAEAIDYMRSVAPAVKSQE